MLLSLLYMSFSLTVPFPIARPLGTAFTRAPFPRSMLEALVSWLAPWWSVNTAVSTCPRFTPVNWSSSPAATCEGSTLTITRAFYGRLGAPMGSTSLMYPYDMLFSSEVQLDASSSCRAHVNPARVPEGRGITYRLNRHRTCHAHHQASRALPSPNRPERYFRGHRVIRQGHCMIEIWLGSSHEAEGS